MTERERPPLVDRVVVLPGRLEYALVSASELTREAVERWNRESAAERLVYVDEELVYARFFADFGPLNLGQVVRFCRLVDQHLGDADADAVVLVSSDHPHKRANAMNLLALYLVIRRGHSPEQAVAPFAGLRAPFGFRDAACGICTFFTTILDCARAAHKAMQTRIWSWEAFSLRDYEHFDELHNGDINWIVPGKILAFSGPQRARVALGDDAQGRTRSTLLAHEYAKVFREQLGVSCVVRFNEPSTYDRKAFVHAGIQHLELEYPDGGNPPDEILYKFLRTCERERGAVAVHCKAGLGRTGTNIAAFLIKNLRFTAPEAIAWCRMCRPGSIVGAQQQFLLVKQRELLRLAPFDSVPTPSAAVGTTTELGVVKGTQESSATPPALGDTSASRDRSVVFDAAKRHRHSDSGRRHDKQEKRGTSGASHHALAPLKQPSISSRRASGTTLHNIVSRSTAALKGR